MFCKTNTQVPAKQIGGQEACFISSERKSSELGAGEKMKGEMRVSRIVTKGTEERRKMKIGVKKKNWTRI